MADVNELLVRIDATTEQLRRELRQADQQVAQSTSRIDRRLSVIDQRFAIIDRAAGLASKALAGYMAVFSVGAVAGWVRNQLDAADAIAKAAEVANLANGSLQELRYAFTQLSTLTDGQVDASLRRFNRRLGLARQEAGPAKAAFDQLFGGVEQFGNTEQALDAVIERLASVEDQAQRAALASAFFGDDAGPLLAAALGKGSAAINQLRQDARELGFVLSDDLINNAGVIKEEFDRAQRILNTAFMSALTAATPLLVKMAEMATKIANALTTTPAEALHKQLEDLRKRQDHLLNELNRPRLLRVNPFASDDKLRAELNEVNTQMLDLQQQLDELQQKAVEVPAALSDGEWVSPEVLDQFEKLEAQLQRQLALYGQTTEVAKLRYEMEHGSLQGLNDAQRKRLEDLAKELDARAALTEKERQAARVKESVLTVEQKLNNQLALLDDLLDAGLLTWDEYSRAAAGAANALDKIPDKADRIRDRLKQIEMAVHGFGRKFEDSLIDAAKRGENAFSRMTEAILEDIARLVIRMQVIQPLASSINAGIKGFFGGANADGNAFQGGRVIPFASGGIVAGPTLFPMFGGKTGLMGEAGPEAIMPLKRGADGKLGVAAHGVGTVVQIIDQRSGGEQPQVEQSRGPDGRQLIRVLIRDEVQAAISGGALDRTFANTYGLRRRGF